LHPNRTEPNLHEIFAIKTKGSIDMRFRIRRKRLMLLMNLQNNLRLLQKELIIIKYIVEKILIV